MRGSDTIIVSKPNAVAEATTELTTFFLSSKTTKLLTDSDGLVPETGEYTMRYCCTGPGAGSQRTSRLLGVGLYTWTFLAGPLTTEERKVNAHVSCLFIHVKPSSLFHKLHSL